MCFKSTGFFHAEAHICNITQNEHISKIKSKNDKDKLYCMLMDLESIFKYILCIFLTDSNKIDNDIKFYFSGKWSYSEGSFYRAQAEP